jgi:lauroyl/myristoyl acyltransferase
MAMEAKAPVIVVAATSQPGGRYMLEATDPIWMEPQDELEKEIIHNANRVLKEAEEIILRYSNQWAMFYPIWPKFLGV